MEIRRVFAYFRKRNRKRLILKAIIKGLFRLLKAGYA